MSYIQLLNHNTSNRSEQVELIKLLKNKIMSPKQKTATKRHSNSRPNKSNLKRRRRQIQDNVELLRKLSQV